MKRSKPVNFRYRAMRIIGRANHWLIARLAMGVLWLLRKLPPDKALDFAAAAAKTVGPWFGRHRTALDNLRQAYPEKSEQEIAALALEMWDNMARLAAEYVFLDQLFDFDAENRTPGRIEIVGEDLFVRLASRQLRVAAARSGSVRPEIDGAVSSAEQPLHRGIRPLNAPLDHG